MIQSGTNLGDFLPRRLAWGIVIAVLLAVAIFALPNLQLGGAERELNIRNRNTYMQMLGMTKAEIQQKLGTPSVKLEQELHYILTQPDPESGECEVLQVEFDATERCLKFAILKAVN